MNTLYRAKAFLGPGFTYRCCLDPVVTQDTMATACSGNSLFTSLVIRKQSETERESSVSQYPNRSMLPMT